MSDKTAPPEPVAWRYKDARGHWRYTGTRPGLEHAILKPEPLYASAQPVHERLTDEDIWRSDELMSINARAGLSMPILMELARAIERLINEHAAKEQGS